MCVGQSVCLSSLRVCSLQGLEGRRVLTDSCQSRLHPHLQNQESSEDPDTHVDSLTAYTHTADTHTTDTHLQNQENTHTDSLTADTHAADTHLLSGTASGSGPAVRVKRSTLISFKVLETRLKLFVSYRNNSGK